jgi:hypothetical protein
MDVGPSSVGLRGKAPNHPLLRWLKTIREVAIYERELEGLKENPSRRRVTPERLKLTGFEADIEGRRISGLERRVQTIV